MRTSINQVIDGRIINGYCYDRQCWILAGIIQRCGHPEKMDCGCYGRAHYGEENQQIDA